MLAQSAASIPTEKTTPPEFFSGGNRESSLQTFFILAVIHLRNQAYLTKRKPIMKQVVYQSTARKARVTYSNFWFCAEVWQGYKWVSVLSARDVESAVRAISA
jgi:hypothetical protein